jgi:hypothetical protein
MINPYSLIKDLFIWGKDRCGVHDLEINLGEEISYIDREQKTESKGYKRFWCKKKKLRRRYNEGWEDFIFWEGKGLKKRRYRLKTIDDDLFLIIRRN